MLLRKHRVAADETGASLIVVLGVTAVGLILSALIATSLVSSLGFSSASRAGLQSQAAADAGVAAARAGLNIVNNCATQPTPGTYSSTDPGYTATVQHNDGSGWQNGCPTAATTQVRIVSTGSAAAHGVAGYSSGDASKVEAVVQWLTPGPKPSGVAMYLYKGGVVEANSNIDLTESTGPGLVVRDGNFDCDKNNSVINGSISVEGNLNFTQNCTVNGSAWVSGAAALGSGKIGQNLTSNSVTPNPPGTHVGGTYTQSGVTPAAPGWVDIPYAPDTWRDSNGDLFEVKSLTTSSAECKLPDGNLGGTAGEPIILDARGCTGGGPSLNQNTTVKLTSDVVIYADRFDWPINNTLSFESSSTAVRRIWFITPDYVADGQPTCDPSTQGDFSIKNTFSVEAPVSSFLYTPCAFDAKNTFSWRGQIYSGAYSNVKNNSSFVFVPVGVAGYDLSSGTATPEITHPQPGILLSNRNLTNGG